MKLAQIAISIAVILFVVWIGDKQRNLAGIVAGMPLIIPLTIWITYTGTSGDYQRTSEFAASTLASIFGTTIFALVAYLLLRARMHIAVVIAGGYAAWFAAVSLLPLLARHASRLLTLIHK